MKLKNNGISHPRFRQGEKLEIENLKSKIDIIKASLENAFKEGHVDMDKIIGELKDISDNLAILSTNPPVNIQDYR
jgi:hypothetical protein